MNVALVIFVTILVVGLSAAVFVLYRNEVVYAYRGQILQRIHDLTQEDIRRGEYRGWHSRYESFNRVSYEAMMFRFWRRLDSWYADFDFNVKVTQ